MVIDAFMTPPSSSQSARPSCLRSRKRLSDHVSPETLHWPKRAKLDPELQEYDEIHQHILLAAAKVLCVPVERLLSLADSSKSSAAFSRSDSQDVVSKSSSDDLVGDTTPPEAPECEQVPGPWDLPYTERSQRSSTVSAAQDPLPTQSVDLANYSHGSSIEQLVKDTGGGTSIDLFAPAELDQTPHIYQTDHGAPGIGSFQLTNDYIDSNLSIW
jgi:hypothetical protein